MSHSKSVIKRVNEAFDQAIRDLNVLEMPSSAPARDMARASDMGTPDAAGGFIQDSISTSGGFVIEDDEQRTSGDAQTATHIPLAAIPSALQLLDLPPNDEQVSELFRNAAGRSSSFENMVSREDFINVCEILLSMSDDQASEQEESPSSESSEEDLDFQNAYDGSTSDDSEGASKKHPTRRRKPLQSKADAMEAESPHSKKPLTRRQKAVCREAFRLFFPDVKDEELSSQRIMIKDISRVSSLTKERLTAEEVVEMLEEFSTAPDKSMSLSDFETMMIATKLA